MEKDTPMETPETENDRLIDEMFTHFSESMSVFTKHVGKMARDPESTEIELMKTLMICELSSAAYDRMIAYLKGMIRKRFHAPSSVKEGECCTHEGCNHDHGSKNEGTKKQEKSEVSAPTSPETTPKKKAVRKKAAAATAK